MESRSARSGAVVVVLAGLLCATTPAGAEVVDLWPEGGVPGFKHDRPESLDDTARDDQRRDRSVAFVSTPALTIHRADEPRATGAAVLVLPGGGYRNVVIDKEGHDIARWLNTIGVSAAVLKYRTRDPNRAMSAAVGEAILADAQRAMRTLRSRAAELGIDPERIGVMGFSAGGDLAIRLAAAGAAGDADAQDPVARVSSRPDFVSLVYPSLPQVSFRAAEAPAPFFIVHAGDDPKAPALLSIRLTQVLAEAGVPFELHAFQEGDHGFALGLAGGGVRWWPTLFEEWLRDRGLLERTTARVVESKPAARVGWPAAMFWFVGPGAAFAGGVGATLLVWLLFSGIAAIARRRRIARRQPE